MIRKAWALAAALLGLLAVNLHPVCALSFDGAALPGVYSPAAVRRGLAAAEAAAEELLPGEGAAERPTVRWSLSLAPPSDESAPVSDAALRATPGVAVFDGVFYSGKALGTVERGERFAGRVQAWLFDSMPWGAYEAGFAEPLTLRPVYARAGSAREPKELLAVLARTAKVWYADAEGRDVPG